MLMNNCNPIPSFNLKRSTISDKEMGDNPDAAFHAIEYFMNSFKSIQWNMPFKFITSDKNIQKESNDDSKGMNT